MSHQKKKIVQPTYNTSNKKKAQNILVDPATGSSNCLHPLFSMEYLGGEYCITKCEKEDKIAFVNKLYILSQITWQEITQVNRHKLGCEKIEKNALKKYVTNNENLPDDVRFLSIRYKDLKPMVGYRKDRIFYIIAIDRDFSIYSHGGA